MNYSKTWLHHQKVSELVFQSNIAKRSFSARMIRSERKVIFYYCSFKKKLFCRTQFLKNDNFPASEVNFEVVNCSLQLQANDIFGMCSCLRVGYLQWWSPRGRSCSLGRLWRYILKSLVLASKLTSLLVSKTTSPQKCHVLGNKKIITGKRNRQKWLYFRASRNLITLIKQAGSRGDLGSIWNLEELEA